MLQIIAIIRISKLEEARQALIDIGISGMTVSEVKGFGRQKGQREIYRGNEYASDLIPKLKIELICEASFAPKIIEALQQCATTGAIGDGKIFTVPVQQALHIRTGLAGEAAL